MSSSEKELFNDSVNISKIRTYPITHKLKSQFQTANTKRKHEIKNNK